MMHIAYKASNGGTRQFDWRTGDISSESATYFFLLFEFTQSITWDYRGFFFFFFDCCTWVHGLCACFCWYFLLFCAYVMPYCLLSRLVYTTGLVRPKFENDDDDGNASAICLSLLGLCLLSIRFMPLRRHLCITLVSEIDIFFFHLCFACLCVPRFTSIPYVLSLLPVVCYYPLHYYCASLSVCL